MALGDLEVKGKLKVVGTTEMAGFAKDATLITNLNADKVDSADLDTDGTLTANSDVKIPSQKAVKTYADTAVKLTGNQTVAGVKTFSSEPSFPIANVKLSGDQTVAGVKTFSDRFIGSPPLLYIEDQKAANTAGGTFTSGTWQKRDLSPIVTNEISGASLASSQITLPAGTYEARFSCPAYFVNMHKAKLYNTTGAADLIVGSSEYCRDANYVYNRSCGFGRFVLTVQSVLELQHRCYTTLATYGLGMASNFAVIEVYSMIEIRKIA
jgi:hypothetical protein